MVAFSVEPRFPSIQQGECKSAHNRPLTVYHVIRLILHQSLEEDITLVLQSGQA